MTSTKDLVGETAACRLRPAASAHRRQAARARLRAAALLGPPHERPGRTFRCLSAPRKAGDIDAPAGFQPGCACWLHKVSRARMAALKLPVVMHAGAWPHRTPSPPSIHHTTIPRSSPHTLRLVTCPAHACTSTGGTPEKASLPPVPPPDARHAIPKIFLVARARDSNLSAPPPCFSCGLSSGFSRRRLSRAHPTHVLLSTAHCKVHVRVPSARACGRCARRGWCVRLSPTSASTAPMHQQQAQAAHLIATVNGRTYTRYALGLCTGL